MGTARFVRKIWCGVVYKLVPPYDRDGAGGMVDYLLVYEPYVDDPGAYGFTSDAYTFHPCDSDGKILDDDLWGPDILRKYRFPTAAFKHKVE